MYKEKFKYFKKYHVINNLLNTFIMVLLINWIFQGIRGMQSKELSFRVILEFLFIVILFYYSKFNLWLCIVIIHTFFWIFLCQYWVINRYSSFYSNNLKKMNLTYKKIIYKILKFKSLEEAIVIGSASAKNKILKINSDLDLRIFFNKSTKSYFTHNLFLYYLRIYSLINKFPLDIYCCNNLKIIKEFSKIRKILIIKDKNSSIKKYLKKNNAYKK